VPRAAWRGVYRRAGSVQGSGSQFNGSDARFAALPSIAGRKKTKKTSGMFFGTEITNQPITAGYTAKSEKYVGYVFRRAEKHTRRVFSLTPGAR
jgi:hypothetical protein